jgi:hypothetical protein
LSMSSTHTYVVHAGGIPARGRAARGRVARAQPAHVVPRVRTGRGAILHVLAEHAGIERRRRVGIFLPGVDLAGDGMLIPVALGQGGSFVTERRTSSPAATSSRAIGSPTIIPSEVMVRAPEESWRRSTKPGGPWCYAGLVRPADSPDPRRVLLVRPAGHRAERIFPDSVVSGPLGRRPEFAGPAIGGGAWTYCSSPQKPGNLAAGGIPTQFVTNSARCARSFPRR